ncbi:hypothetical protein DYBT9623_02487 [Dyadobacter sp. CECT 9623]|uniref:Uncharacterized protein n=1 Tax=Dyadobacter linearis TaxID=2823330 RepID=A0ABM8UQN4_9BACT|nr:hypothetical protein [Dyadobacter sp. CECT 9623]CAG5069750.1 hypothetical protein DYBT9623_02487 [Dyadobacter sp. CECT 9623]
MAGTANVYEFDEEQSSTELRYVFLSVGKKIVSKIVVYTCTHQFENRDVYNLGFGDYFDEDDNIEDRVQTNNGDAYVVFNTVLATIPLFFEKFSDSMLMVQGSDSRQGFAAECKRTCLKNCKTSCRKSNQRISIYRNFVEKHFLTLSQDYWFLGGFRGLRYQIITEIYIPGRKYDAILMFRK